LIAAQNPDVVVLQEVQTWDEYQPTRIPALLQQTTGQTWYTVWVPAPSCVTGGCIGELILSRIPIAASTTTYLGPSDAGRALIYVGNVPINILTNHLEYYDTALRTTELNGLMAWARGFGGPRLVGGDFNSWWGEWWISQMQSEYHDTWFDVTKNRDGGYTVGNVRFDYIFRAFDGDWRVTPTNVFVVSTTLSDHRPVVADFSVQ
jgi:endonuclease/exonuclease/phosphatase (EEP) superfamily protein YafD